MPVEGAQISVVGSDGSSFSSLTDGNGSFRFAENVAERYILENTSYSIVVEKHGRLVVKDQITTVDLDESTTFLKEYFLADPKIISCPVLPEVFFQRNTSDLTFGSDTVMAIWMDFLQENPSTVVEVVGHVDADESIEIGLARSQAICTLLVASGIPTTRLIPTSKGRDAPLIPMEEIKKMTDPAEVEAAHALDRYVRLKMIRHDWHPE